MVPAPRLTQAAFKRQLLCGTAGICAVLVAAIGLWTLAFPAASRAWQPDPAPEPAVTGTPQQGQTLTAPDFSKTYPWTDYRLRMAAVRPDRAGLCADRGSHQPDLCAGRGRRRSRVEGAEDRQVLLRHEEQRKLRCHRGGASAHPHEHDRPSSSAGGNGLGGGGADHRHQPWRSTHRGDVSGGCTRRLPGHDHDSPLRTRREALERGHVAVRAGLSSAGNGQVRSPRR